MNNSDLKCVADLGLNGRRALITGAAGGIGAAIARAFAQAGCRIAIADLQPSALEGILPTLAPHESGHIVLPFDLADSAACEAAVQDAADRLKGLDVVVHAGAALVRQSLEEVSLDSLRAMTAVNMWGSFFISRKAAQLMARSEGGSIVLFSSQGAYTGGFGGATVYSMTKAAVNALIKSLAREYADQNVRVNGIAPGAIDTPMMSEMTVEARTRFLGMIPMKRMGEPEEVAACCAFLASPRSRYITGQMLHVNGGQLML